MHTKCAFSQIGGSQTTSTIYNAIDTLHPVLAEENVARRNWVTSRFGK